jgi:hypothetical protein
MSSTPRSTARPALFARAGLRLGVAVLLFVAIAATVPRWWCGRDGHRWFDGSPEIVLPHAREVAAIVTQGVSTDDFTSASELFKNEWLFGSYQMAAIGLLQVCAAHPAHRAELLPAAEHALDELLSPRVRAFDARIWGEDPLDTLETSAQGHAAYLGYLNIALGLHRALVPDSRFAPWHDRISAALARRLATARHGILETYPKETYPVDNAAVLGSLLLHARVAGADHSAVTAPMLARFRRDWRDPASGLLFQSLDPHDGRPLDGPRASGTTLAAFLLSHGEDEVARDLYLAARAACARSFLGFGFLREYPAGSAGGAGDIDSGPLIFGVSPSATGFLMGPARRFGDRARFVALHRTAHLMGAPVGRGDGRRAYVTGGPLGNALLLALFTSPPAHVAPANTSAPTP